MLSRLSLIRPIDMIHLHTPSIMLTFFSILVWLAGANAHLSAFHKAMFCLNGTQKGVVNQNANAMVVPLFDLDFDQWWFHHVNGCDEIQPLPGDFLDIPAGKNFTVEIAANQAFTTLSYGGKHTSEWVDGKNHSNFNNLTNTKCISNPNIHTPNKTMAAGTSFAISYQSDLSKVTQDNLVVFSVAYHTPWTRVTTYQVPAKMPPCPPGGCICSWNWIPDGCGTANMYMQGFKCNVTNSISTTPLATPKPAVWCEGAPNNCTQGAKQVMGWHQNSGNNIAVTGFDLAGMHKSPGYNSKCGFDDGPQNDIFAEPTSSGGSKRSSTDDEEDTNIFRTSPADIFSHRRNSHSFRLSAKSQIPRRGW